MTQLHNNQLQIITKQASCGPQNKPEYTALIIEIQCKYSGERNQQQNWQKVFGHVFLEKLNISGTEK